MISPSAELSRPLPLRYDEKYPTSARSSPHEEGREDYLFLVGPPLPLTSAPPPPPPYPPCPTRNGDDAPARWSMPPTVHDSPRGSPGEPGRNGNTIVGLGSASGVSLSCGPNLRLEYVAAAGIEQNKCEPFLVVFCGDDPSPSTRARKRQQFSPCSRFRACG